MYTWHCLRIFPFPYSLHNFQSNCCFSASTKLLKSRDWIKTHVHTIQPTNKELSLILVLKVYLRSERASIHSHNAVVSTDACSCSSVLYVMIIMHEITDLQTLFTVCIGAQVKEYVCIIIHTLQFTHIPTCIDTEQN